MESDACDRGKRPFQCNDDKTNCNGHNLDDRDSDNEGNEYTNAGVRLDTAGVAQYATSEVPKKLAEKHAPEACPNCIYACSKGDVTTQLMPDEFAHPLD